MENEGEADGFFSRRLREDGMFSGFLLKKEKKENDTWLQKWSACVIHLIRFFLTLVFKYKNTELWKSKTMIEKGGMQEGQAHKLSR